MLMLYVVLRVWWFRLCGGVCGEAGGRRIRLFAEIPHNFVTRIFPS